MRNLLRLIPLFVLFLVLAAGLHRSRDLQTQDAGHGPILLSKPAAEAGPAALSRVSMRAAFPIGFEANQGGSNPDVKFVSRGPGYALFLTAREAVIRFR